MTDPLPVTIRPLTPSRFKDLEAVFEAKGCSIARGCWCMFYRETGRTEVPKGARPADVRKARMRALCEAGPPPGLLAYAGKTPVGWVTLGPRRDFLKLARSPVAKPVDDTPLDARLWSVVCFVVPPAYRHRGVAHALLQGAVAYAAKRGARIVEAYPVDKAKRGADDWMWHGAKLMYDRAGFAEVARRKPQRPVVRLHLQAPARR
ncbi:MAG: GNAT family N-acetyltransferase [Burkholderiaceae bacterium]|jgi:GNAT superfamily N-acetyltransferase|nr:GNAT family N-acetyltransferase [Burkholderiaceae bacterium]